MVTCRSARWAGGAGLLALTAAPAVAQPPARQIAAQAQASVLVVTALGARGDTVGTGTGFVVREDGVFVTNYHVVEEAAALQVETLDGVALGEVFLLAADAPRDLAILQASGAAVRALPLGRDAEAEVGDRVYVMGNPLGMNGTFSDGLVSAKRPVQGVAMLQISAPISPGSSGGPVMNERGEVIGVATLFAAGAQNLNLAVPVRYVKPLLAAARQPRRFGPGVLPHAPPQGLVLVGDSARPIRREPGRAADEAGRLRQVRHQLQLLQPLLGERGFGGPVATVFGTTAAAEPRAHSVQLQRGVRYLLSAHCDSACRGVRLEVEAADGARVGTRPGDLPTLTFTPERSGRYALRVDLGECAAARCGYAVGVFAARRDGVQPAAR